MSLETLDRYTKNYIESQPNELKEIVLNALQTNGTLITEESAKFYKENNF